jgi:hypothetical protein
MKNVSEYQKKLGGGLNLIGRPKKFRIGLMKQKVNDET